LRHHGPQHVGGRSKPSPSESPSDRGSPPLKIEPCNGGQLAHDELLDRVKVLDEVCQGLERLAAYAYRAPVLDDEMAAGTGPKFSDVGILGHVFEQLIGELE